MNELPSCLKKPLKIQNKFWLMATLLEFRDSRIRVLQVINFRKNVQNL